MKRWRILVAVDFRPPSLRAVRWAREFAGPTTRIDVVWVLPHGDEGDQEAAVPIGHAHQRDLLQQVLGQVGRGRILDLLDATAHDPGDVWREVQQRPDRREAPRPPRSRRCAGSSPEPASCALTSW